MTLGKIKSTITHNDQGEFSGMDLTAEYLNPQGKVATVSFHYLYHSINLRGLVEQVLATHAKGTVPHYYSNIVME